MTIRAGSVCYCLVVLGSLLLGSCDCGDSVSGCPPTDRTCNTPVPVAGQLALEITTPHLDDRAVVLTIVGDFSTAEAATGYELYEANTAQSFVVVATGNLSQTSRVLRIDVPDLLQRGSYSATITEVAARDYRLRPDLSVYRTSFVEVSP